MSWRLVSCDKTNSWDWVNEGYGLEAFWCVLFEFCIWRGSCVFLVFVFERLESKKRLWWIYGYECEMRFGQSKGR